MTEAIDIALGPAAGTSVMFGFVPLAARGLYADGLSTWSFLCWRYLLALGVILAGILLHGWARTRRRDRSG